MSYLNPENRDLVKIATLNSSEYLNAKPFPNIQFDHFFEPNMLETVLNVTRK